MVRDDNWSYKMLKSSSQIVTNKPTSDFLLAGCTPKEEPVGLAGTRVFCKVCPSYCPTNSLKPLKNEKCAQRRC